MTKGKIYPIVLMVLVAIAQIYSAISLADIFPISSFAMYSSRYDSKNLQILRIACVKERVKSEKFIAEFDQFLQESHYTSALTELVYAELPLQEQAIQFIRSALGPLQKEMQQECSSLKVYRYTWAQFTGKNRYRPDKLELLYEMAW